MKNKSLKELQALAAKHDWAEKIIASMKEILDKPLAFTIIEQFLVDKKEIEQSDIFIYLGKEIKRLDKEEKE